MKVDASLRLVVAVIADGSAPAASSMRPRCTHCLFARAAAYRLGLFQHVPGMSPGQDVTVR